MHIFSPACGKSTESFPLSLSEKHMRSKEDWFFSCQSDANSFGTASRFIVILSYIRIHVTVYKTFVCTRARSSRAFLSSPFLVLVIGRFHRQSRRVSVARSARCDVVQGQGHMVTGGRGGHTRTDIYRLLVVTPPSPFPLSSLPHVIIDVAPRDDHHYHPSTIYMYTYVTIKYAPTDICARTSFDPASRSRESSGSRNTAAQQWCGVTPFNPL